MTKSDYDIWLNKKIAKLRHTETNYDKHLDLMYDNDGNQTDLRKHINNVLYKIAVGELNKNYLVGIKSEIKYEKRKLINANWMENRRKKKKKNKPRFPSNEKMQEALLRGYQNYQEHLMKKWLGAIKMKPKQIRKMSKNLLIYQKDSE